MQNRKRIFIGMYTFIASAMIGLVAILLRGPIPVTPSTAPESWAKTVTSMYYFAGQVGILFAYCLSLLGYWALSEYLSNNEKTSRLAFSGAWISIWGTALALATLGIFVYVSPAAGKAYLEGQTELVSVLDFAIMEIAFPIATFSGILYTVGPALLGIAIWRSGTLSKVAALLFILHGACLSFGFTLYPILIVGWLIFLVSVIWITQDIRK